MCEESSLQMNKEASSEKEILDSEKFKTEAVAAGLDKFHVPIETLLGKVKKNTNLIQFLENSVDNITSLGEKVIELFLEEVNQLNVPDIAKVALKKLTNFVSVLMNSKFQRVKKHKNLLKIATKVALKTWQEQNQSIEEITINEENNFCLVRGLLETKMFLIEE